MSHRVHAAVHVQQAPPGESSFDRAARDAERVELGSRDHAVLAPGQRADRPIHFSR
jgi:hypothetical protein